MLLNRSIVKQLLLFFTPLVSSLSVAASPSLAATLAFSSGTLVINNYSQNPDVAKTSTDTDTLTNAKHGSVDAFADAEAIFSDEPLFSFNTSVSESSGTGRIYRGSAKSQAEIVEEFLIRKNQSFSFDFIASWILLTSTDNSRSEVARADGKLSFSLFDITNRKQPVFLDSFSILAGLKNLSGELFNIQKSQYVSFDLEDKVLDNTLEGEKLLGGFVVGNYSRNFANKTRLKLIGNQLNYAEVKTPEPSGTLALSCVGLLSMMGIRSKRRKQVSERDALRSQAN
ncbi:hypothetical protein H6F74_12700 [Trichocoleus sp. FACHB-90]|uniref:hypothetical protein n=1 Tax=Cyanophyceae TaxID=3028117 RepID=UPI001689B0FF|nr:hypothetical protein [Trichocoleus sp. FACHB-90]MBD1927098.1 hypothetical protein [Trichocoleus sp. FACHB-90]